MVSFEQIKEPLTEAIRRDYKIFESPELSLIEVSENMTCLVRQNDRKYILQINREDYRTDEQLEGEFAWLQELNGQLGVRTANLYTGVNGKVLQHLVLPGGKVLRYSLQEFLEGVKLRTLGQDDIMKWMKTVGGIAAELHNASERRQKEKPPLPGFRWDIEELLSRNARWGCYRDFPGAAPEELQLLEKLESMIIEKLEKYGRNEKNYGLIHSDIHAENILISEEGPALIDFDDCGYSWYLYDLGSAVSKFSQNVELLVGELLEGYERIRPLSDEDREMVPVMILMRRLVRIGWLKTHTDNGRMKPDSMEFYRKTLVLAERYIKKEDKNGI